MLENVGFVATRLALTTNFPFMSARTSAFDLGQLYFASGVSLNGSKGPKRLKKVPCAAVFRENSPVSFI